MSSSTFVATTLLALCLTNVYANSIRCYSCDDCIEEKPTIVQCSTQNGIDLNAYRLVQPDPILTPPPLVGGGGGGGDNLYPGNPLLTPPPLVGGGGGGGDNLYPGNPLLTPPPLVGGGGNSIWNPGYPFDPLLTPPPLVGGAGGNTAWYPGNPLLTPPPLVGGNPVYPWGPLLTPPPYPYGKAAKQVPAKPEKRFVCVTVRSTAEDGTKDITHRRGCAEIEGYASGICEQQQHVAGARTSCRVCGHSLCNE
ncbi:protein diaphanous homolog 1-like [Anopheles aquasalis]|uniref:protein diaphanous homolog 1-like n=1 Tax=Anopheles aquasalis TaxID=42839 RepID=UPI00215A5E8B|nr:protein diaphanous homolog 1-like [Anopheles aquasalis]